jgi:hypothetical protein
MADKYESTQDQMNQEMAAMHEKMTDPELQEKKMLEDNHKQNVESRTKRYGLG